MTVSRRFDVYYSDLDTLILECVHPVLDRYRRRLAHVSWERHFARGPHLRIRIGGGSTEVDALCGELRPTVERFLRERPSPASGDYSIDRTIALLAREGAPAEPAEALEYRNNLLVASPVAPAGRFVSPAASDLLAAFQHDSMPLAVAVLGDQRPRREVMLRLYFLQALVVGGDLRQGSVSWRSHWEGLAASTPAERLLERIRSTYRARRDRVAEVMLEVRTTHEAESWDEDPILGGWRRLLLDYRQRVRRALADGQRLTRQPADAGEAQRFRRRMTSGWVRESEFLRTFCSDDSFLTAIQYDRSMLVPRVLVNLLYVLVAAAGLTPLDKFALCYFAHRAVEEHFDCDLQEILESNMAQVASRYGARAGA